MLSRGMEEDHSEINIKDERLDYDDNDITREEVLGSEEVPNFEHSSEVIKTEVEEKMEENHHDTHIKDEHVDYDANRIVTITKEDVLGSEGEMEENEDIEDDPKYYAYLYRGDYNIFTIDWADLTNFPCYLSSLSNTRVVSQCTAKLYAFVMDHGGKAEESTCVGHSLGAHICGMVSNHLTIKQHKIVGLDPARPLIDRYANKYFRLTKDDAYHVQIIHTNSGFLGEVNQIGHVDFCVNGGMRQPGCKGNPIRIARCSHFQSACYFAKSVKYPDSIIGKPCSQMCPKRNNNWGYLPGRAVPMGHDTPYGVYGTFCVSTDTKKDCPFE